MFKFLQVHTDTLFLTVRFVVFFIAIFLLSLGVQRLANYSYIRMRAIDIEAAAISGEPILVVDNVKYIVVRKRVSTE